MGKQMGPWDEGPQTHAKESGLNLSNGQPLMEYKLGMM